MNNIVWVIALSALALATAQAGVKDLYQKAQDLFKQAKSLPENPSGFGDVQKKGKELFDQGKKLFDKAKEYKPGVDINDKNYTPYSVEVKNTMQDIWIAIETAQGRFRTNDDTTYLHIPLGTTKAFTADISSPYELLVWTSQPVEDSPAAKRYKVNANETAYVAVDAGGALRPQKGPLEGKLKKTDSGLSLAQNVKSMTPVS